MVIVTSNRLLKLENTASFGRGPESALTEPWPKGAQPLIGDERKIQAPREVAPIENEPNVELVRMPYSRTQPTEHKWWQIFR